SSMSDSFANGRGPRERVVERQERPALQIAEEEPHPQSADAGERRAVRPIDRGSGRAGRRRRDPKEVEHPEREERPGDRPQDARGPPGPAEEEDEKRRPELEQEKREGDPGPAARRASEIPAVLPGQIARPDDEVLRERQVRPEHDERQEE